MTWADLRRDADKVLPELVRLLADGRWRPGSVRAVEIPTYTGKLMPTAVPTVVDRMVHRAMRNAIEPVLEARAFADWVSGFRPGRNRLTSVRQAMAHLRAGYRWVTDVDVCAVSDGARVDEVVDWLARYVHDGTFLNRVRMALLGLPLPIAPGSGLAPMLINLRLSQVDAALGAARAVRFADNYCVFSRDRRAADEALSLIDRALRCHRMAPNPDKVRIRGDANAEDLFLIGG